MRSRRLRGDRGASLFLVIGFMVLIGGVLGGLLPFITTGLNTTASNDRSRSLEYAADAAVEEAIAKVRNIGGLGPAKAPCPTFPQRTFNGVTVQAQCENRLGLAFQGGALLEQLNVLFWACAATDSANCAANFVVKAQVNYDAQNGNRTLIQAWSVNR